MYFNRVSNCKAYDWIVKQVEEVKPKYKMLKLNKCPYMQSTGIIIISGWKLC